MNTFARRIRRALRRYREWRDPIWRDGWAALDVNGERLYFKETYGATYWWADQVRRGRHERAALDLFASVLAPGQVVLDIGAWIGMYTLLASRRVGPQGHVYAFEPNPASRAVLSANLERNRAENVTVVPAAVFDEPGRAWLRWEALAQSPQTEIDRRAGDLEVPAVALAAFCATNEISPSVIKIDVEGAESDVLADDAVDIVRRTRSTIVEIHDSLLRNRGVDPARFLERLAGSGLEVRELGMKSPHNRWIALQQRAGAHGSSVSSATASPVSPATE